ncbi:MAG: tetratricopeptide repeat protein [Planctomycetes bacterium]|nr:tetratricopeptide repeat protein [Planctomycetota bacterium]
MIKWGLAVVILFGLVATAGWLIRPEPSQSSNAHEATESDKSETNLHEPADPAHSQKPKDLAEGDQLLHEGRFAQALRLYDALAKDTDAPGTGLRLRIALCHEALGLWDEAMTGFRKVASGEPGPDFHVAILGQTRLLIQRELWAEARNVLQSLLLGADSKSLPESWLEDLRFYRALSLALQCLPKDRPDALEDFLAGPRLQETDPARRLEEFSNRPRKVGVKTESKDQIRVQGGQNKADQILLQADVPSSPTREVLERLALAGDLKPHWSIEARQRVESRTTRLEVSQQILLEVIRAIGEPLELVFYLEGDQLHLEAAEEKSEDFLRAYRAAAAQRALRECVLLHPEHALAPWACLCLGNMSAGEGNREEAVGWFQRVVKEMPRSRATLEARYNLGLVQARLGQTAAARKVHFEVLDQAPHHELAPLAALRIGRAFMEEGEPRAASAVLKRALASAAHPRARAAAAVALAAALSLTPDPPAAAKVLEKHRDVLQAEPFRSSAALVAAHARFQTIGQPTRRQANDLLNALMGVQERGALGPIGTLLAGMSYGQLDMWDQAVQTYEKALTTIKGPLREEMSFRLGEALAHANKPTEASQQFAKLAELSGPWAHAARFQLAKIDLHEKRWTPCIEKCWGLLREATSLRGADVLTVMGQAFEGQGNFAQAARCFAGEWPEE